MPRFLAKLREEEGRGGIYDGPMRPDDIGDGEEDEFVGLLPPDDPDVDSGVLDGEDVDDFM